MYFFGISHIPMLQMICQNRYWGCFYKKKLSEDSVFRGLFFSHVPLLFKAIVTRVRLLFQLHLQSRNEYSSSFFPSSVKSLSKPMGFILRAAPASLVKQLIILLIMLFQTVPPTLSYVLKCRSFLPMPLLCNALWGRKVSVETRKRDNRDAIASVLRDSEFLLSLLHTSV